MKTNKQDPARNIEIKARARGMAELLDSARKLGATEAERMEQVDTYFEAPHGRLKLRVIDGERAELIYYRRPERGGLRGSDYWLASVADPEAMLALLSAALGRRGHVTKRRRVMRFQHTRIHLDTLPGWGEFVELETVLGEISEEEGRAECARVAQALGIRDEDRLEGSYVDLCGVLPEFRADILSRRSDPRTSLS